MLKKDVFDQDQIHLNEEDHKYSVKTAPHLKYTSVTTFIHEFFHEFDAEGVAAKLAKNSYGKYGDKNKKEILKMWDKIAERGTLVHNELENYLDAWRENQPLPLASDVKTEHGILFIEDTFESFYKPYPEMRVFSNKYQLAGTIDLLIHNEKTDRWVLADWKTNTAIRESGYRGKKGTHYATRLLQDCNFIHYTLQMSLYQYILETEYGIQIDGRYLLHLRPSQTIKYPLGVKMYECEYLKYNVEKMLEDRLRKKENGELHFPLK